MAAWYLSRSLSYATFAFISAVGMAICVVPIGRMTSNSLDWTSLLVAIRVLHHTHHLVVYGSAPVIGCIGMRRLPKTAGCVTSWTRKAIRWGAGFNIISSKPLIVPVATIGKGCARTPKGSHLEFLPGKSQLTSIVAVLLIFLLCSRLLVFC